MGGKRLKFPARKKFVAPEPAKIGEEEEKEEKVSDEEHEKRIKMLKELGLIK